MTFDEAYAAASHATEAVATCQDFEEIEVLLSGKILGKDEGDLERDAHVVDDDDNQELRDRVDDFNQVMESFNEDQRRLVEVLMRDAYMRAIGLC